MRRFTETGSRATSMPSICATPSVGNTRVVRIPIVVVLPAPFGPSSPKNSPRVTSKEMPSSALTSTPLRDFGLKVFFKSRTVITVSMRLEAELHMRGEIPPDHDRQHDRADEQRHDAADDQ